MPKSTQTRFLGIRDNHNHYTSLRLLLYRPIDVDLFKACYTWSVLDLRVGEIYVLPRPVSQFLFIDLFMIPMLLKKASVGMYNGCDYLLSLKILFILFGIAIPTSSFKFYSIVL